MAAELSDGKKVRGRPFQKGKSPCPGGRRKEIAEIQDKLLNMTPMALEHLRQRVLEDDWDAIKTLLSYVLPKPEQGMKLVDENGKGLSFTINLGESK